MENRSYKETTNCKCEKCFKRERDIIRINKKGYDPQKKWQLSTYWHVFLYVLIRCFYVFSKLLHSSRAGYFWVSNGEGNGNPLQYSCLENPMDGGAWWARQRVRHNWATSLSLYIGFPGGASGKAPACQCRRHKKRGFDSWIREIPWRGAWQPTLEFLPGESHGQRSLEGYSPQGCRVEHDARDLA